MNLIVVPKPSGNPRASRNIDEVALASMTLVSLRAALLKEKLLSDDEVFLDQGVPMIHAATGSGDEAREKSTSAMEITIVGGTKLSIEIMSRENARKFFLYEKWIDRLPIIDVSIASVSLAKPTVAEYQSLNKSSEAVKDKPDTRSAPQGEFHMQVFTSEQVQKLLENCGLYPKPLEPATCAALRFGKEGIEFGRDRIITCKKIRVLPVQSSRKDRVSCSYSQEINMWQSQLVETSSLGMNVPLLFGFRAASESTQADGKFESGETIYCSRTIALPKLEILLEDVSLSDMFVQNVQRLVEARKATELLDLLAISGLFVATGFLIGGKVVARSSKVLKKTSTHSELDISFRNTTSGVFNVEKSLTSGHANERTISIGTERVSIKTVGGYGEQNSSEPGKESGSDWLLSVATEPAWWRVIGYRDEIKTILEYLPADLRRSTKALLRQSFERQLMLKQSAIKGGAGGAAWTDEQIISLHTRLAGFDTQMDQNIDRIRFIYEDVYTRRKTTGSWHGKSEEKEYIYVFDPRDEIVAVEVGWDVTVDHVIFHTKQGDNKGKAIGMRKGAKFRHTFQEPRIRGFVGRAGHFLDALGVLYYDFLPKVPPSHRQVFLFLERYLHEK